MPLQVFWWGVKQGELYLGMQFFKIIPSLSETFHLNKF